MSASGPQRRGPLLVSDCGQPQDHKGTRHRRPPALFVRAGEMIERGEVGLKVLEEVMRKIVCSVLFMVLFSTIEAEAQAVPGGVCRPVSERTQDVGCWILANDPIGELAGTETGILTPSQRATLPKRPRRSEAPFSRHLERFGCSLSRMRHGVLPPEST